MQVVGIPLLHLTAANNRQVASTVVVSPTALLDDGMLVRYVTDLMWRRRLIHKVLCI
jgi:hypothetical protein